MIADRICEWCGSSFEVARTTSPKRYCSQNCRSSGYQKSVRERKFSERSTECPECGTAFLQNPIGAPRKYCADKCKQRVSNRAARRRWKPLANPTTKRCAHCDTPFIARSRDRIYCYNEYCKYAAYRERKEAGAQPLIVEHAVSCDGCGKKFVGKHPTARWCSKYCANKYWGRVRSRRRYAADGSALYVDREVFERDNWTCYLCNLPVDPELDRLHEFGATIDHIVPLSRGGLDELSNVALAHWSCNRTKRAS